ncbi:MAG: carbon-nitrogen family hydrolase [Chloroflexi bacterium]|nr:carbon-nitrogen family hydrolase [Chloroflexota bacterium]
MDIKLGQPEHNFERAAAWTGEAARRGSQLVLFPELWSTGYALEDREQLSARLEDPDGMFRRVAGLARQHRISVGGSLLERRGERAYNTFALFGPDGQLQAQYSKVHLFRLMDEDKWLSAGERLTLAETEWGLTGLGICYDLRFPEMFRRYALGGARLILLPAQWPSRRATHWQTTAARRCTAPGPEPPPDRVPAGTLSHDQSAQGSADKR